MLLVALLEEMTFRLSLFPMIAAVLARAVRGSVEHPPAMALWAANVTHALCFGAVHTLPRDITLLSVGLASTCLVVLISSWLKGDS
jgi:membrane protease YdiL (CAAX protease family)